MHAVLITLGNGAMRGYGIIEPSRRAPGSEELCCPIARMLKQRLLDEVSAPAEESDGRKRYYRATGPLCRV